MDSKLNLKLLPAYAEFLLNNKIHDFVIQKLKLLEEFNVPLYQSYKGYSAEELINLGTESTKRFLNGFKRSGADNEYLINELLANKFPFLSDKKIVTEDITSLSFIQRKLFRDFLVYYTTDQSLSLKIMEEVDFYTMITDSICHNQLMKLNEKEIKDKQNFILKIAELTPSIITVYDVHSGKYIFVNKAIQSLLGYSMEELIENGLNFLISKIHPQDFDQLSEKNSKDLRNANLRGNSEEAEPIVEFLYRIRHKNGEYNGSIPTVQFSTAIQKIRWKKC